MKTTTQTGAQVRKIEAASLKRRYAKFAATVAVKMARCPGFREADARFLAAKHLDLCLDCALKGTASDAVHGTQCAWCSPGYLRRAGAKDWYVSDYRPAWAAPGSTPPGW